MSPVRNTEPEKLIKIIDTRAFLWKMFSKVQFKEILLDRILMYMNSKTQEITNYSKFTGKILP